MITRFIIFWCLVTAQFTCIKAGIVTGNTDDSNDTEDLQKKPICLTGYMTDVQSWVDRNGNLSPHIERNNAIDLSANRDPVSTLLKEIQFFARSSNSPRRSIRYLSMAKCNLKRVPTIFELKDRRDQPLHMTVEYLTLYGNDFAEISVANEEYGVRINATDVEPLNINFRRPEQSSWTFGFNSVTLFNLKELDLRRCNIQQLTNKVFQNMPYLKALYLGENAITYLRADAFYGLKSLIHLDLSNNLDSADNKMLTIEDSNIFRVLDKLISLDLSHTIIQQYDVNILKSISRKLQRLSLCCTGLFSLPNGIFSGTSLKFLDVSSNKGILNGNQALAGLEDKLEVLYAQQIGLKTFHMFLKFSKIKVLNVASNEISSITRNVLVSLKDLMILNLGNNRITSWFTEIFKASHIKFLSLRNNNLNVISKDMLVDFEKINFIGLSGNSLICNCQARELFELAYRNQNKSEETLSLELETATGFRFHRAFQEVSTIISQRKDVMRICDRHNCSVEDFSLENDGHFMLFDYDIDDYTCLLVSEDKYVQFYEIGTCNQTKRDIDYEDAIQDTWMRLLSLLVIPTILFPVLIFCYVFKRNLRYFCITIRNSATLSLINKDTIINDGTIFNYDVFVSYCNEDRNWVLDYLLPHVEKGCNVSVCLHERDFQVGLSILENIVSCMDRSRCIMLVISRQFLLSQWCQFEMHLAQHRLLETRREDLILVLLEDVPRRLRPTTLHYLMLTKTYIIWPKEKSEHHMFFKRLIRRLSVHSLKLQENVSLA